LLYIAAVLEKNNYNVKIVDANALNLSPRETRCAIRSFDPDIVGFSILTPAHNFCLDVVKQIQDVTTVAGGPHATVMADTLLLAGFDAVVHGEGEEAFLELLRKPLKDVLGISWRSTFRRFSNPDRDSIQDLDSLPFPARHLLPNNGISEPYRAAASRYKKWATILTSRGCPYSCYFCNKNIFGYKFRVRSPKNVLEEIEFLVSEYGVKEIDIADDVFNLDLKRAEEILDMIISENLNLYIRATNGLRIDHITESFLRKFKKAGGDYIAYGIESGNQKVLDMIPKHITLDQVRKVVSLTKKVGLRVAGFFIFGLIGDTKESMEETLDFSKRLDLDIAVYNTLAPYPGTRVWDIILESGGSIDTSDFSEFHHTSNKIMFSLPDGPKPEDILEIYKRAHREFYFRKTYVLRELSKVRSFAQLKELFRGASSLLRMGKE